MLVHINRESAVPLYSQIKGQLQEMILTGVLAAGFRLPAERKLAQMLEVNRSTILTAYNELKAEGLIESQVGRGTVVIKPHIYEEPEIANQSTDIQWRQLFNAAAARSQSSVFQDIVKSLQKKDVISFALGTPPPDLYPIALFAKIQDFVLAKYGSAAVSLLPTEGYYPLRVSISKMMALRGVRLSPEEIIVLSGSQQGIELAGRVFLDPGDIVITEEPTFFCAMQVFRTAGARMIGIPIDENGMKTDILETVLARCRPKFIYTIPTFQNPSGKVLSLERRRHLLDLSVRYQVPIIEDDPNGRIFFGTESAPLLKALDQREHVIYLSSFTKLLFPGLRIGWLAAPRTVIRQFVAAKQWEDIHSNSLSQYILDEFLRQGHMKPHLEQVRRIYRERRDATVAALEKYAPCGMTWDVPEGGFYIWCRLPEAFSESYSLLRKAVENGVSFMPGEASFTEEHSRAYIRLNFTMGEPEVLTEGIRRLTHTICVMMAESFSAYDDTNRETTALV